MTKNQELYRYYLEIGLYSQSGRHQMKINDLLAPVSCAFSSKSLICFLSNQSLKPYQEIIMRETSAQGTKAESIKDS